ncbi:MAG: hypothetical protein QW472_04425 [Candidatus Aenigmatarchaeota archaeon]
MKPRLSLKHIVLIFLVSFWITTLFLSLLNLEIGLILESLVGLLLGIAIGFLLSPTISRHSFEKLILLLMVVILCRGLFMYEMRDPTIGWYKPVLKIADNISLPFSYFLLGILSSLFYMNRKKYF